MGQSRVALLYGVIESEIKGDKVDDLWDDLPDEITLTEDGCVGVVVGITYDNPPMQLPLPVSQIMSRYSSAIDAASRRWDKFREHSKALGIAISDGQILLCEVECA